MVRVWWVVAIGLGLTLSLARGDSLPRRQSADWQADLIRSLIDEEMLDSAEAICARHFASTEASTDDAARWAIRWSSVRAARLTSTADWQPQAASAARQPIEKLLQAYPDHARRPWLETQLGIVDMATVRHAVLALAITPGQQDLQARGLDFVRSALRQWESTGDQIQALNPAGDEDLRALQQTLAIQRVEALLWRSRLFVSSSDDAIASATEAEQEARRALSQIGPGTRTHQRVMLLRAEALTAMGNPDQALQALDDVQSSANGQLSAEGLALQIRALMAKQDWNAAATQLNAYYGPVPERAPRSVELDLTRLAFMLAKVDSGADAQGQREQRLAAVADWLDAIERRSGVYARRRGEAEALRVVRVKPNGGDTRLLAAEAARQLRSGNTRQAGQLLAQAAAASDDAAAALKYAAQAAAVLKSVDRIAEAAEVLTATAMQHSRHESAPGLHLQAAWLIAEAMRQDGDSDVAVLQSILEATARRWPETPESRQAVDWLVRLLEANRGYADAAGWVLSDRYPPSVASIRQGGRLWQAALRQRLATEQGAAEQDAVGELLDQALASLQSPAAGEPAERSAQRRVQRLRLVALFAPPDDLRQRWGELGVVAEDAFAASLLKFRREAVNADTLVVPVEGVAAEDAQLWQQTLADAVQRLQRDGQGNAAERARLGKGMLRLLDAMDEPPAGVERLRARALAWSGQWQQAEQLFQKQIDASPGDLKAVRAAAEGLAESANPQAKRLAIEYWTRIAAGVPQGSGAWHQAKLATIRLHLAVQDRQAAIKLGRYVLITRPPEDQALREQYEQLLREAGEQP
ncbi:hypothetical protein [Roseimaritima ulvae]|uniref:Anaphase-promoting complex, cyclosome, subunit 3 n=1 Tax=Roseimaritima ulvae TaxID=980254 RepID=A0A5B9QWW0_9BACT|nr:hypothetical protein [Roseimaritima ulvae]QEG38441.1 hypothetical protein UC8_03980 [Roseimaritima ulvae]